MLMAKNKQKHEWSLEYLTESAGVHVGKIIDNMSPRDLVYILAYGSAVYVSYVALAKFHALIESLIPKDPWQFINEFLFSFGYIPTKIVGALAAPIKLDSNVLAEAMVAGYMLLKIDVGDVASAISKVTSIIAVTGVGA
jgi:hypothetical protein